MFVIKKSVIFDIEQRYFLLNKIKVKFGKALINWRSLLFFIAINKI